VVFESYVGENVGFLGSRFEDRGCAKVKKMQGRRHVAESEVVLAFLRGEINSGRFGSDARQAIMNAGGLQLIQSPDLESLEQNQAREQALSEYRGWRNAELFIDFPDEVERYHGIIAPDELERVRFIDYSYWNELSGGSRQARDVRRTIEAGALPEWLSNLGTDWCFEFADQLATAEVVDDLIVMGTPDLSDLVLLEGHARLTAIFVGGLQRRISVNAYVGLSKELSKWDCF
jgi:hypothetical protein